MNVESPEELRKWLGKDAAGYTDAELLACQRSALDIVKMCFWEFMKPERSSDGVDMGTVRPGSERNQRRTA